MEGIILNKGMEKVSLQVSKMGDIPGGDFKLPEGGYFLVKNNTENFVRVSIKPANNDTFVDTLLAPGWNPEIVKEIKNAPIKHLQYGY